MGVSSMYYSFIYISLSYPLYVMMFIFLYYFFCLIIFFLFMSSLFFFFSSRRRHTRYWRDWSSDVCSSDLCRYVAHCLGYLPARRIAQCHHHGHGIVLLGMLLGLAQLLLHALWQAFYVADDAEPHVILRENLVFERAKHESHEGRYLVGRPVPVLGRECVKREKLHSQARTLRRYAAHSVYPGLMPVASLLATFGSPAAITIHDDGNMLRDMLHI